MHPRSHLDDHGRAVSRLIPLAITLSVALVLLTGTFMVRRAQSKTNQVALASRPKPVSVVEPKNAAYRPFRTYIGTIQPLIEAHTSKRCSCARAQW
jgi:hypothetical protein